MLEIIEQPDSLAEMILQGVCDHLRIMALLDAGDDSPPPQTIEPADLAYIRSLTETAVSTLNGPKGRLGRCLLTQRWSLWLDHFPPVIELPLPPLQTITCLKYLDTDGAWQTIPAADYRVSGAKSWRPEIAPAPGKSWPATQNVREAVEVRIKCGYGDTAEDVPEPIKHAIRELVAHWYVERQPVTFSTPHVIPLQVDHLIQPYRIYR